MESTKEIWRFPSEGLIDFQRNLEIHPLLLRSENTFLNTSIQEARSLQNEIHTPCHVFILTEYEDEIQLILVRESRDRFYNIPGGYQSAEEHLYGDFLRTVSREAREEAGLDIGKIKFLGVLEIFKNDPVPIVPLFAARVDTDQVRQASPEICNDIESIISIGLYEYLEIISKTNPILGRDFTSVLNSYLLSS